MELPGEVVAWAITSHATLRRLLADPRVSTDPVQHWPRFQSLPHDWPLLTFIAVRNMFTAYGADHRRLRSLISKAFTPRRVEALRPSITQLTHELLDRLATTPPGQVVDLREEFAYPIPIEVICRLFGVPDHVRPDLHSAVEGVFHTAASPEEAQRHQQDLYAVLREVVDVKRRAPGEDMTSVLIAARDDEEGSRLTEEELVDTHVVMLGAGHETTLNLLDHAVTALLTHPDQLAAVRRGDVEWSDVVEESLRWQAPIASLPLRYAVEDIDVDGVTIRKGDAILPGYAAANRDPERHEDADRFDVTRSDKEHLAFGHGAHFCLGAPLARLEASIALPALFDRFPDLSLAVEPERLRPVESFIANGHRELPVFLTR